MSRRKKVILGFITLPPFVYFLLFALTPMKDIFSVSLTSPEVPDWVFIFVAFHFFMFLYGGLLWAFYMVHLFGDRELPREKKALWALFLAVGIVFALPIYWLFRIWRKKVEDSVHKS